MAIMEILAIIPARSGSKSIKDKNIREVAGKPLIAWSIEHALASKLINRVIVSTDSSKYAEIARHFGAEVPFFRPKEIAEDTSTDLEVFIQALTWLDENEKYIPDICVHLRPTYPVRDVADIDKCIEILLDNHELDSVRSIAPACETPYKMWFRGIDGLISQAVASNIREAYNRPRQELPDTYIQNACIDVVRTSVITKENSMTGKKIFGYLMADNHDIDYESQLLSADQLISDRLSGGVDLDSPKTFCFDIDGVIASIVPNLQYSKAEPIIDNIALINHLYEAGHKIILHTARGSKTGVDCREITRKQMIKWCVCHHELHFGKPAADYYVDDRFLDISKLKDQLKRKISYE